MSTLNVLCAICSEYFKCTDSIYTTTVCGHIFHQNCLFRWLIRSNTCPQCRSNCHRHRVHKIFLNFSEPGESEEANVLPKGPEWIYCDSVNNDLDSLLHNAMHVGTDDNGDDMYIARTYLHEDLLPAYYAPQKRGAYAAWNCKAHLLTEEIELLIISNDTNAEYKWVTQSLGAVPPNAILTGYSDNGETLYTARAEYENRILYGKLHPSHGVAYMPYRGVEVSNQNYEVLTRIPKQHIEEEP